MTCRLAGLALAALTAQAAIFSQNWHEARLTLELDDGTAEVEWISPVAFRVARSWGGPLPPAPALKHDPVLAALEDASGNPRMRTRYLTVDFDAPPCECAGVMRMRRSRPAAIISMRQTWRLAPPACLHLGD